MAATPATVEPTGRRDAEGLATSDAAVEARAAERVLLAGASGRTGRRALRRLAASPLVVRALTSSPEAVDRLADLGADETVVGDLLEPGVAGRAVEGCDVAVSAVGSRPADVYRRGPLVDGEGNENLIAAADAGDARAFVMVSALGAGREPPGPMGRLFRLAVGPTLRAKGRAEAALRESGLRHTVLRPAALVPDRLVGGVVVAEPGARLWGVVARDDVARLAVAAPFTPAAADRTFEVARNPLLAGRDLDVDWRGP